MNTLKDEISALTMKLDKVAGYFYQQKPVEGYQGVELILKDIEDCFTKVVQYKAEIGNLEFDEMKFVKTLGECVSAMEEKDTVLLADILSYDLRDSLEEVSEQLLSA